VTHLSVVPQHLLLVFVSGERSLLANRTVEGGLAVLGTLRLREGGEKLIDPLEHLGVAGLEVAAVVVGDEALLSYAEYPILRDLDAQVGDGVSLPVSEACDDGLFGAGKNLVDAGQQFDFELVWRFLYDLSGERLEVSVGTHQQRSRGQVLAVCINELLLYSTSFLRNFLVCAYWLMALAVM
jgi:hypothetical protein